MYITLHENKKHILEFTAVTQTSHNRNHYVYLATVLKGELQ